jgi:hypothetical protein
MTPGGSRDRRAGGAFIELSAGDPKLACGPRAVIPPAVRGQGRWGGGTFTRASPWPGTWRASGTHDGQHGVFKARVKDSTLAKGKSSGYRLVYAVDQTASKVTCLFVYHKADLATVKIGKLLDEIRSRAGD